MSFLSAYKSIRHKHHMKEIQNYVSLSRQSVYENSFRVEIREPMCGKCYMTVGDNCILGNSTIFETKSGNVSIGNRVHIGGGTTLISHEYIEIEDDVTIAWGCTIYDHDSHSIDWNERKNDTLQEYKDYLLYHDLIKNKDWDVVKSDPIIIKEKAWLGFGVIVLKGVTIGEGAVVGAGSVVTKSVAPWTVVAGNPAKPIKNIQEMVC